MAPHEAQGPCWTTGCMAAAPIAYLLMSAACGGDFFLCVWENHLHDSQP